MSRSKHGTAYNDTSEQTEKQRESYETTFGANSMLGRKTILYGFNSSPTAQDIMLKALLNLNNFNIPVSHNPDFNEGITDRRLNTFGKGVNKFTDVANAKDLPNRLGPNIKALDINNPPLDDSSATPAGHTKVSSPTNSGEEVNVAGFGTHIDRNDPNASPRVEPYLQRRGARAVSDSYTSGTNNKLGEYLDSNSYEYTE